MTVVYVDFHRRKVDPLDELLASARRAEIEAEKLGRVIEFNCNRLIAQAGDCLDMIAKVKGALR